MNLSYGKQYIDKSDEKFILKSIYDTKITDGKQVKLFENKLKKKLKSKYCISCNSATSGLLLSFWFLLRDREHEAQKLAGKC